MSEFNKNWEEDGHICPYEHCIEEQPLDKVRTDKSCPLFGHNCPYGSEQVKLCNANGMKLQ